MDTPAPYFWHLFGFSRGTRCSALDHLTMVCLLFSVLGTFFLFPLPSPSPFPIVWLGSVQQLTEGHIWKKSMFLLTVSFIAWRSKVLHDGLRLFWRRWFWKHHVLQLLCSARHLTKHYLGLERVYTFFSFFPWIPWVRGAFMKGWTWWVISTSMSVSIIL